MKVKQLGRKLGEWYNKRKAERAGEEHKAGWDFAAGLLLEGFSPGQVLEYMDDPSVTRHFDRGIDDAVVAWMKLKEGN